MSFAFHYNEKVKVTQGFYAENKGVVVDWTNKPVEKVVKRFKETTTWLGIVDYNLVDVKEVVGSQRLYLIHIQCSDPNRGNYQWIPGHQLEKV